MKFNKMKGFPIPLQILLVIFLTKCRSTWTETSVDSSIKTKRDLLLHALPKGYTVRATDNVAYKAYFSSSTWDEARARCKRDGGDLAIVDTYEKHQYIRTIIGFTGDVYFHVGIQKPYGFSQWKTVAGDVLPVFSIPWEYHQPATRKYERFCAQLVPYRIGLLPYDCSDAIPFICAYQVNGDVTFTGSTSSTETMFSETSLDLTSSSLLEDYSTHDESEAYTVHTERILGKETEWDITELSGTTTQILPPSDLPEGYAIYPGNNVAYKIYYNFMTWDEARSWCKRDGGDLAVADTFEKIRFIENISQFSGRSFYHVGIEKPYGFSNWKTVTDVEISASLMPWAYQPLREYGRFCAQTVPNRIGLLAYYCSDTKPFVCEIPVLVDPIARTHASSVEVEFTEPTTKDPLSSIFSESYSTGSDYDAVTEFYEDWFIWTEDIPNVFSTTPVEDESVSGLTTQDPSSPHIPEGYSIYPGNNVAYKIYNDRVTWDEANDRCISDGGNLATADTYDLVQLIRSINSGDEGWLYVGISQPFLFKESIALHTDGKRACAAVASRISNLWYIDCKSPARSICEIRIIEGHNIIVNNASVTKAEPAKETMQAPPLIILPEGYSPFPDGKVAYKIYKDNVTWDDARDRCISDGGDLAVVYTREKIQQTRRIDSSSEWLHVGIFRPYGSQDWIRTDDGSPVKSVTWAKSPSRDGRRACALLARSQHVIWDINCSLEIGGSICEIPFVRNADSTNNAFPRSTSLVGYSTFKNGNIAYKIYKYKMTWDEARDRCISDGGDLAATHTRNQIQLMRGMDFGEEIFLHVGIHKPYDTAKWVDVHDGLPVNSPYWGRSPVQDLRRACALIFLSQRTIWDIDCNKEEAGAICEIPIGTKPQSAVIDQRLQIGIDRF